jgi:hypothetical protein
MGGYYVGLDVHNRDSVCVIQDDAGVIQGRGMIPTTAAGFAQLCEQHQLPPGTTVALETGTSRLLRRSPARRPPAESRRGRCPRGSSQGLAPGPKE